MARRVRSRRRRAARAVRRRLLGTAVLGTLAIVSIAMTQRARFSPPRDADAGSLRATEAVEATASIQARVAATDPERPVFPYSVVPGGVHSVDELRNAIATDAIVADHYKGFDLSKAHVERLTAPRFAHVSYRLGEHIYWTRNPLVLPAGERVITDGTNIARTRCGNQVAIQAGATSPAEPSPLVLDTPTKVIASPLVVPAVLRGDTPAAAFAALPSGLGGPAGVPTVTIMPPPVVDGDAVAFTHSPNAQGTPPDEPPIDMFEGPGPDPRLNPGVLTPVPEPSSLMLILTGAGGFLVRRLTIARRGNRSDRS